jgi:hypothetical protein
MRHGTGGGRACVISRSRANRELILILILLRWVSISLETQLMVEHFYLSMYLKIR